MNRRPERLADLLPGVVADLAARHNTTNGAPMTAPDRLVLRLAEAIRHWTEDPDRCDMEGREDEVGRYLLHVVANELRMAAEDADRATTHLAGVGAYTPEQVSAAEAVTFGLRARAGQLEAENQAGAA